MRAYDGGTCARRGGSGRTAPAAFVRDVGYLAPFANSADCSFTTLSTTSP